MYSPLYFFIFSSHISRLLNAGSNERGPHKGVLHGHLGLRPYKRTGQPCPLQCGGDAQSPPLCSQVARLGFERFEILMNLNFPYVNPPFLWFIRKFTYIIYNQNPLLLQKRIGVEFSTPSLLL